MGTTYTGLKIKNTYGSIIKVSDNSNLTAFEKQLSDGLGNDTGLYIGTNNRLGIGISPTEALHVSGNFNLTGEISSTGNRILITNSSDPELFIRESVGGDSIKIKVHGSTIAGNNALDSKNDFDFLHNNVRIFGFNGSLLKSFVNIDAQANSIITTGVVSFGSLTDSGESITITKFVDETDGIGNNDNDTTIPTSAAVKDYVDTNITAQDLDFSDGSTASSVDLDSQTFVISGTSNEIETSASGQTITIGLPTNVTLGGTLQTGNQIKVHSSSNAFIEFKHDDGSLNSIGSAESIDANFGDKNDMLIQSTAGKIGLVVANTVSPRAMVIGEDNNTTIGGQLSVTSDLNLQSCGQIRDVSGDMLIENENNSGHIYLKTKDSGGNFVNSQITNSDGSTFVGVVAFDSLKDTGENITISKFVDEADGIGSNDNDTTIPTSAAVKDFVDSQITAEDLDFSDGSTAGSVDLNSQTFVIQGTANEVETSASSQTLTIGLPNDVTISGNTNVNGGILNLGVADTSSGNINAFENMTFNIDTDNDDTSRYFAFYTNAASGGGTELLKIEESGNATFAGIVESSKIFVAKGQNVSHGASQLKISQEDTTKSQLRFYGADTSTAGALELIGSSSDASVGGTRLTINSSGQVGIGTSPGSILDIVDTSATTTLTIGRTGEVPEIKAGGTNTDLRISAVGSGGFLDFQTNANSRLKIDSSGRVGIGMTPSDHSGYPLQLTGGSQTFIAIGNDTTGTGALNGLIIGNDSTGADIYQRENQPLRFHTNNTQRVIIDNSGKVGVGSGSTSLVYPLEVHGVNGDAIVFKDTANSVSTWLGAVGGASVVGALTDDDLAFYAGSGGEQMRLDSSGNLSIGSTDNNGRKVRIAGAGDLLQLTSINDSAAGAQLDLTHERPGGAHDDDIVGLINFTGLDSGSNNTTYASIRCFATSTSSETGDIVFVSRTDSSNFTEKLRIRSDGATAIGITPYATFANAALQLPSHGLAIKNNISGSSNNWSYIRNTGTSSNANIEFTTGIGIALTLNHDKSTTFSGNVTLSKSAPTLELSSTDGSAAILTIGRTADTSAQIKAGDSLAGDLTFSTGGNRRIQIANGGDITLNNDTTFVGKIITSSTGSTTIAALQFGNAGLGIATPSTDQLNFITADESRVIINSSGNLGIGGSSTAYKLRVLSDSTLANGVYISAGSSSSNHALYVENQASSSEIFAVRGDAEIRLNASRAGSVLIGTTALANDNASFEVGSSNRMVLNLGTSSTSSLAIANFKNPNGVVGSLTVSGSSTSFNSSSDYRLKENIVPLTGALDRVNQLKPNRFNFKTDKSETIDGFLAHEVSDIVPQAITGTKDEVDEDGKPVYQAIDHSKLVPLLVGAIQELKKEIEILKNK